MMNKALLIAIAIIATLTTAVWAGVSLSPMITEIVLPPGQSYSGTIQISNTGTDSIVVEALVRGFTAPEGVPIFLDPSTDDYAYSGRGLLTISPSQQTVAPGQAVIFRYHVTMPTELNPYGGRYVAAVFRVKQPAANNAQVVVSPQVASLFLLDPGGDVSPHFKFTDFKVWQDETTPRLIHCSGMVTNDGNVHVDANQLYGFMQITDPYGAIVGTMMWHPHTMLPNNTYRAEETWRAPDTLPSGKYYLQMTVLVYGPNGQPPQTYHATVPVELNF